MKKEEEAASVPLAPTAAEAAPPVAAPVKKPLLLRSVMVIAILLASAVAGVLASSYFFKNVKIPGLSSSQGPKEEKGALSDEDLERELGGEIRTFKLKSGQVIRGVVTMEDEVFYTVETFGGKQEVVIKEDLAE